MFVSQHLTTFVYLELFCNVYSKKNSPGPENNVTGRNLEATPFFHVFQGLNLMSVGNNLFRLLPFG